VRIGPQSGPQEKFMSCTADIAFFGGGAGGGKTVVELLDPLRCVNVPGFGGVIFRRTYSEITNEGGLWDTAAQFYIHAGAIPKQSACEWYWPKSDVTIAFSHMQHEKDKYQWQGSAIPYIAFDELTHFTKGQFFYMVSRNRLSKNCGVKPYIRGTCNPDPCSWVATFIAWWIDDATGLPIPERDGVIRWFIRDGENILWEDNKEDFKNLKTGQTPKSFTFIRSLVTDNIILMANDPNYIANLHALPLVERERLLNGNWKVRAVSGMIFRREWFGKILDAAPAEGRTIRYWDRAATEETPGSGDPDWTAGVKMRVLNGIFYILDVKRVRATPDGVRRLMRQCADQDGHECEIWAEKDPGSAGVSEISILSKLFPDRRFYANPVHTSKITRAWPMSAQVEAGNVKLIAGRWNEIYLQEMEMFADWTQVDDKPSKIPHDDQVDGSTGAFNILARGGGPAIA